MKNLIALFTLLSFVFVSCSKEEEYHYVPVNKPTKPVETVADVTPKLAEGVRHVEFFSTEYGCKIGGDYSIFVNENHKNGYVIVHTVFVDGQVAFHVPKASMGDSAGYIAWVNTEDFNTFMASVGSKAHEQFRTIEAAVLSFYNQGASFTESDVAANGKWMTENNNGLPSPVPLH